MTPEYIRYMFGLGLARLVGLWYFASTELAAEMVGHVAAVATFVASTVGGRLVEERLIVLVLNDTAVVTAPGETETGFARHIAVVEGLVQHCYGGSGAGFVAVVEFDQHCRNKTQHLGPQTEA